MENKGQRVLEALLERLYSALSRGPALNGWPGRSRQRVDLADLEELGCVSATEVVRSLLLHGEAVLRPEYEAIPAPREGEEEESPERKARRELMERRKNLLRKLALVADEARTYQQDTGSYVLYIGYPVLSMPEAPAAGRSKSQRIFAPVCFLPVELTVGRGNAPRVVLSNKGFADEPVFLNEALKTWLERQLAAEFPELPEPEDPDAGPKPEELLLRLSEEIAAFAKLEETPNLMETPVEALPEKVEGLPKGTALLPSAVLGMFPLNKQTIIQDMRDLQERPELPATVAPFLTLSESLTSEETPEDFAELEDAKDRHEVLLPAAEEHHIAPADPCQRRAVITARKARGLVVHGPPGTGKSQTITNMIADYLANGKRVLVVCEKRTALDVVKYRLDRAGLGHLCAVVHDATRDREPLYKGVRAQLEDLADARLLRDPAGDLAALNEELDRLHQELHEYFDALTLPDKTTGLSFHELAGRWLETYLDLGGRSLANPPAELANVPPDYVLTRQGELRNTIARAQDADYAENCWAGNAGLTLDALLGMSMDALRGRLTASIGVAKTAAEMMAESPAVPPYDPAQELLPQANARREAAEEFARLANGLPPELLRFGAALDPAALANLQDGLQQMEPLLAQIASAPLPAELEQVAKLTPIPFPQIQSGIAALGTYLDQVKGFFGFFKFAAKKEAAEALKPLGLSLNRDNAQKGKDFFEGLRARLLLVAFLKERLEPRGVTVAPDDRAQLAQLEQLQALARFKARLRDERALGEAANLLEGTLAAPGEHDPAVEALSKAPAEVDAIQRVVDSLQQGALLSAASIGRFREKLAARRSVVEELQQLEADLPLLEPLLRFEDELDQCPPPLAAAIRSIVATDEPAETCWQFLLNALFHESLQRLLRSHPNLQRIDKKRLQASMDRYRELAFRKQQLEAESIAHVWQNRQRGRLLAGTGTRLNSAGADLRRRLMLRGRNASRIRQVIHGGHGLESGDPLFDIHPVWMASPEVVSQIFPAEPLFDVLIFDEASQCRLEEAIPALTRGQAVVIAGDTKQLPPTRFFEAAAASSTEEEFTEGSAAEDALFASQQADIEDLLTAALNIEIEQAFLDVHYQSTNAALIEFSNQAFYGARLQPIPANPRNVAKVAPVRLHRVDGTYTERTNPKEAEHIVTLVKELLSEPIPPSIGIVSFNMTQRDLIAEALEEEAEQDSDFRESLEDARQRWGHGSFEGLFVKNLENVQGDERDIIIISTTFGPAADGKFRRNFGPLSQRGGERRLNVLITRARRRVELITSIPSSVYRQNLSIPEGQRPTGSYYLMQYLAFAEDMDRRLREEEEEKAVHAAQAAEGEEAREAQDEPAGEGLAIFAGTGPPSPFVEKMGELLATQHRQHVWMLYGNEGFCMDLTLFDPRRPEVPLLGVLIDAARYHRAEDRVEWDLFQLTVHETQRWEIERLWTPHFLRDPKGTITALLERVERLSHAEEERTAREKELPE